MGDRGHRPWFMPAHKPKPRRNEVSPEYVDGYKAGWKAGYEAGKEDARA